MRHYNSSKVSVKGPGMERGVIRGLGDFTGLDWKYCLLHKRAKLRAV